VAKALSSRLMKDLQVHKLLSEVRDEAFSPDKEHIDLGEFMYELKDIVETWPAAQGLQVELAGVPTGHAIHTDPHLLYRVMANMILNACEASGENDTVRLWTEKSGESTVLKVWNDAFIPEHIAPRIFQRHFSTKLGRGRGVGTHSMKFIGEQLLGGQVSFATSQEDGTVFSFAL
jgi:signal transduction histidine kinase